jgi:hypothetical protein
LLLALSRLKVVQQHWNAATRDQAHCFLTQAKTAEFTISRPVPAKVKTGQTYVIMIKDHIGTGMISVPRLGPASQAPKATRKEELPKNHHFRDEAREDK